MSGRRLPGGGVRRDCQCPRARHRHGTKLAYTSDACRCRECRSAHADYMVERNRQVAYGRWDSGYVDAEPVREHLRTLAAAGISPRSAAHLSGVSHQVVALLVWGKASDGTPRPSRRMRRDNASALLAVRPDATMATPYALIDRTGTRRRLQALVALGWPTTRLAEQLGISRANFAHLLQETKQHVRTWRANTVRDLYSRLSMTLPPQETELDRRTVEQARSLARRRGWPPPLAWDDDELDDPDVRVDRSRRRKYRKSELTGRPRTRNEAA